MSGNQASNLRAARSMLGLNNKSVARSLSISDKTLTLLEQFASPDDERVARIFQFYEDLGLKFDREEMVNEDGETISANGRAGGVIWLVDGRGHDTSRIQASYLRAARSILNLDNKSVARGLRISDRTLTRLEQFASPDDERVARIFQFYEDLGLKFVREESANADGETIYPVAAITRTDDVNQVVLRTKDSPDPAAAIEKLCTGLRHIGGLVYNLRLEDKGTASAFDTMEAHIPVPARVLARHILNSWVADKGNPSIEVRNNEGENKKFRLLNRSNIQDYI